MLEPPVPTQESKSNIELPTFNTGVFFSTADPGHPPRRNRWQRSRCSQRPPGRDHSLGFPVIERGGDGESSSSEMILFQTPIIDVESQSGTMAPSSSSALPPISEMEVPGSYPPKETSTPKFGTYVKTEDPWATKDEAIPVDFNSNNVSTAQSSRADIFNYGAAIWKCLREGDDPWYTD